MKIKYVEYNPTQRVGEIAEKLALKENAKLLERVDSLIEEANAYAVMMVEKYGFNETQNTHKSLEDKLNAQLR